jgi:hypothetical protein
VLFGFSRERRGKQPDGDEGGDGGFDACHG